MLVKPMLVTDSVTNIAASSAGRATDVSENRTSAPEGGRAMIASVFSATNQLCAAKIVDVAERSHQQRAAGRVQVVRVDVVQVLVVDVDAGAEVAHRPVHRPSRR